MLPRRGPASDRPAERPLQGLSATLELGGRLPNGAREEYHGGRHFRDAKVFQVVEGQNQLHRAMVAEYALGYRVDKR